MRFRDRFLVSIGGEHDKTLKVWNLASGDCMGIFPVQSNGNIHYISDDLKIIYTNSDQIYILQVEYRATNED